MSRTIKFLVTIILTGMTFLSVLAAGWAASGLLPAGWPLAVKVAVIGGLASVIAGAVGGAGKYWAERPGPSSPAEPPAPQQHIGSITTGPGSVSGFFSGSPITINNRGDEGPT